MNWIEVDSGVFFITCMETNWTFILRKMPKTLKASGAVCERVSCSFMKSLLDTTENLTAPELKLDFKSKSDMLPLRRAAVQMTYIKLKPAGAH